MRSAHTFRFVFTATGNKKNAETIARALISERAAACVSIIPNVRSIYRWNHKIMDEKEWILIVKTKQQHLKKVERVIQKHHTYDVPEIVSIALDTGANDYLQWLAGETGGKGR